MLLLVITATVTDLAARRIRNWTTYPAIAYGMIANALHSLCLELGWDRAAQALGGIGIVESVLGGILCFSGAFTIFLVFSGGAGDVKFISAIGTLVGWRDGFQVWLCTMLLAAVFSLIYTTGRTGLRSMVGFIMGFLGHVGTAVQAKLGTTGRDVETTLRHHLPMAPFYTVGVIIVLGIPYWVPGRNFVGIIMDWL